MTSHSSKRASPAKFFRLRKTYENTQGWVAYAWE